MNTFDMTKFDLTKFDARAFNKQMGAVVDYWTETYVENVQKMAAQMKTVAEKQVEFADTMFKSAKTGK